MTIPHEREPRSLDDAVAERQTWEPLKLTYVGHVAELVQSGLGKSGAGGDPGENLKEEPSDTG